MPAQESFGADQKPLPAGAGEGSAQGCQQQTIGRLPAWSTDLALEDAKLVTEGQDFYPKPGVGLLAEDKELD